MTVEAWQKGCGGTAASCMFGRMWLGDQKAGSDSKTNTYVFGCSLCGGYFLACPFDTCSTNDFTMRSTCEIALELVSIEYSVSLLRDPIQPTRFLLAPWRRFSNRDVEPRDHSPIFALLPP